MVVGLFAIVAFNLVDTFFVAQLGTRHLAAMSFTFPVVMLVVSVALGLGTGAAVVIAGAIGEGDAHRVRRLTTHALVLSVLIVALLVTVGLFTIDPLFTLMGATPDILPLVREYMTIWYLGMIFVVVPMVGNNAIRATGDMKYPSAIMVTAGVVNAVLDPFLIFGWAGLPRMGLAGAALATVFARALTFIASLAILHFREKMLDFSLWRLRSILDSSRRILYIALPTAATRVLTPLAMGVITRIAAGFGPVAVAAVGAGTRVQAFALIVIGSLSAVLVPFIGQNWGAGKFERVRLARTYANRFSLGWGVFCVAALLLSAGAIARIFSDEPDVIGNITLYLWIVPLGYGLQGVCLLTGAALNAINRPLSGALLNLVRMFALHVPLAYIGSRFFGLTGLFGGMALASVIAGAAAVPWFRLIHDRERSRLQAAADNAS